MEENEMKLAGSKEDLEELNIIEIARSQKIREKCVESLVVVVSKFIQFPNEDFKNLLAAAADNLVRADGDVRKRVAMIGKCKAGEAKDTDVALGV